MRATKFVSVLALSFLLLNANVHETRAADIVALRVRTLLQSVGIQKFLYYDLAAYNDGSKRWELDVYSDTRQIDPKICRASITVWEIELTKKGYMISGADIPRSVVALWKCEDVKRDVGYFAEILGKISDQKLVDTMHAVFDIASEGPSNANNARFESAELKPLLRRVNVKKINAINVNANDISVTFFVPELKPDILGFRVTFDANRPDVYVYRENSPDIMPRQ